MVRPTTRACELRDHCVERVIHGREENFAHRREKKPALSIKLLKEKKICMAQLESSSSTESEEKVGPERERERLRQENEPLQFQKL